jgi:hypothetical protein
VLGWQRLFAQVNLNAMPIPRSTYRPSAPPNLRDFLMSPGFVGAGVLIAAIVVFCAVWYAAGRATRRLDQQLERQDLHHENVRADRRHAELIDRCWERFVWLVETAGKEPAAQDVGEAGLGLGPELALELLRGLHRDANELGDETLARAVTVYLAEYALVLGRQGGLLPKIAAGSDDPVRPLAGDKPSAAATMPMKSRTTARRTRVRDMTGDQPAGTH